MDRAQRHEREQWQREHKRRAPDRQAKRQKSVELLRQARKKIAGLLLDSAKDQHDGVTLVNDDTPETC